jgi:excinuclease ABC subunit C
MKDASSNVIYVGKAKDLKSRVSSYFIASKDQSVKTRKLIQAIDDFEVMLVETEVEALLLERTLIRNHQPHYNILLRDDKEYPYVRIHFGDDWPRLEVVRRRKDDGADYFGPFSAPGGLKQGLDAVKKVFPLIRCSTWEFQHAKRVCNYYHMKMCLGPCVLPVEKQLYHNMLHDAMDLLLGKNQEVLEKIHEKMLKASEKEQYEFAGQYRDQIRAIESLKERQSIIMSPDVSADAIGLCCKGDFVSFHIVGVRSGKVLGGSSFSYQNFADEDATVLLRQFILQYYEGRDLPKSIITSVQLEDAETLSQAIAGNSSPPSIITPIAEPENIWSGLILIATKNAAYQAEESARNQEKAWSTLEALQKTLSLTSMPRRIECIDISNLQGTAIVASNVCFMDAHPEKALYRSYNIKSVEGSPDDFQSIYEVVKRRLTRGVRDGDLPDLLVIDGGKGQLESALKAQAEFPGLLLNLVSLAKSRVEKNPRGKATEISAKSTPSRHSFERVFVPGKETPIALAPGTPTYRILTQIRDEAHRFAIGQHRTKRKKISEASPLDSIHGVGPKIRRELLLRFESLEGIARASIHDLEKIKGVSSDLAVKIHAALSHLTETSVL